MITYYMWKAYAVNDLLDCLMCTILSICTILLDIAISPIELIAFIIWKFYLNRKGK